MIIATAGDRSSHRPVFYIGAAVGCLAPLVVALVPRRRRLVFWAAAFAEIPALTLMQAYSGGAASGYSVLVIMPMVWFGLEATDLGSAAGMLVLAACGFLPMVLIGPPAYPLSWGHAALLTLVGVTVAGSLRAVVRELGTLARRFAQEAVVDDLTGLLNRRGWRYTAPRELARAARTGNPITVVTMDLDNFKELNDELGHEQGDRALRATAERIRTTLRAGAGGGFLGRRGLGSQGRPRRAAAPFRPRAIRRQGGRWRLHRSGATRPRAAADAVVHHQRARGWWRRRGPGRCGGITAAAAG